MYLLNLKVVVEVLHLQKYILILYYKHNNKMLSAAIAANYDTCNPLVDRCASSTPTTTMGTGGYSRTNSNSNNSTNSGINGHSGLMNSRVDDSN